MNGWMDFDSENNERGRNERDFKEEGKRQLKRSLSRHSKNKLVIKPKPQQWISKGSTHENEKGY